MAASLEKVYSNGKFTDPEWYTALAVDFLDFKWGAVAKDLSKALKPDVKDTAKELTQLFIDAFNCCDASVNYPAKVDKAYFATFEQQQLDADFPTYHRLFHLLLNQLKQQKFSADALAGDESTFESHWVSDLRGNFANEFAERVQFHSDKYPAACQYIAKLKFGDSTETKVIRHANELLYQVEQEPLAIDQQLTLHQSYVSPSCTVQTIQVPNKLAAKPDKLENECLISTLVRHIAHQVQPIVLHGQPGHGKSSSVKVLARTLTGLYQQTAAPPMTLLFEFKHLGNLNRSVIDVLNQQASFIEGESFFSGKNTVLIFDGLDERQASDGGSDQHLKDFVTALFNLSGKVNNEANSRLNLIVTGRSQYVGQIRSCFNKNHVVIDIIDFSEAEQDLWLIKFNQQKRLEGEKALSRAHLIKYKLDELVSQPILLTISAIMLTDKKGQALIAEHGDQPINRAIIYHTIIEWSYQKRWHSDPNAQSWQDSLSFAAYFTLLQAIAFEMVRAGQETIKLSVLADALDNNSKNIFELDAISSMTQADLESLCAQLRISFFFKGVEDKAFAFIHKSFKDFLLISGMVDAVPTIFDDFKPKKANRTDESVICLFGQKPLVEGDHFEFLQQWLILKQDGLEAFAQQANGVWRHIVERQIEIREIVAAEQQRVLATTTYNYLQLVSRWFSLLSEQARIHVFDHIGYIVLFYVKELEQVGSLLKSQQLEHKYYNGQWIDEVSFNGPIYKYSFVGCFLNWFEPKGCYFDYCNFNDCNHIRLELNSCDFSYCHFSGIKLLVVNNRDYEVLPPRFYCCDFGSTKIEFEEEDGSLIQWIDCDFEGANLDDADGINCLII